MQAALAKLLKSRAIMRGDRSKPDVELVNVVLGTEIDRRSGLWQRVQPILAGDMRDVLHEFDD